MDKIDVCTTNGIFFKPSFFYGDEVVEKHTGRRGRVTRVWVKYSAGWYDSKWHVSIKFEYSIKPLKLSYNQFRAIEEDLATTREDGIAF